MNRDFKAGLVSVIALTYNHEKFVKDTIESILNQTLENFQLIIADDASTDNTQNIIKEYAAKDPRIVPVLSKVNGGISKNMNKALKKVEGEFIAVIGGDDLMFPNKLERQKEKMQENHSIGFCSSDMEVFDSETNNCLYRSQEKFSPPHNIIDNLFFTNWFFKKREIKLIPSASMYRSEYYTSALFDLRLATTNEVLHGIDIYMNFPHFKFAYIPEVLGRYRIHSNNISRNTKWQLGIEDFVLAYTLVKLRYPSLIKKANNYLNFFMFQQLLFGWVPKESKLYFEAKFRKEAGVFKYVYLKLWQLKKR